MSSTTSTPRPPVARFDSRHEIGLAVVDALLGAERFARRALLRAARGGEHARAAGARQLNRRRADAARSAMNQDRLARPQPPALEHVRPDRERRLRERGGVR